MRNKILGAKVKTLCQLKNKGGTIIEKGEVCTIVQSYRGYGIRTDDYRQINRVEKSDIEFLKIMKCKKCGGRLALVTGNFYYEPDEEPYLPDVQEEAIAKGGECELIAYKCDLCGHLEGFLKT
jgi:hypothetical protein